MYFCWQKREYMKHSFYSTFLVFSTLIMFCSCGFHGKAEDTQTFKIINHTNDEWIIDIAVRWSGHNNFRDSATITIPSSNEDSTSMYFLLHEEGYYWGYIGTVNYYYRECTPKAYSRITNTRTQASYEWKQDLFDFPIPDIEYQQELPLRWDCIVSEEETPQKGHHTFQCLINDSILNAAQTQRNE